jgi:hypothetical protein
LFGCAFIPRPKRFNCASEGVCEGQRAYERNGEAIFDVGGFRLSAAHYFKDFDVIDIQEVSCAPIGI